MFLNFYKEQIKNHKRIVLLCELFRKLQFLTPRLYEGLDGVFWLENNDHIFYWLEKKNWLEKNEGLKNKEISIKKK